MNCSNFTASALKARMPSAVFSVAIAFPKTADGNCLMTDSPAGVEPKQLRDLHLELKAAKPA